MSSESKMSADMGQNIGIMVLAAGASTRMGAPKQLMLYRGKSLLRHTADIALSSCCRPILVVLGAQANRMKPQVNSLPIETIDNPNWSTGMGSSIQVGIKALLKIHLDLEAVIILLCDQPLISPQLIRLLIGRYRKTAKSIVACEYAQTDGVPALFDHSLFPKLLQLTGQTGAKQVIQTHSLEIARIPFPEGVIDVDTPSDYERLQTMGRR